MSADRKDPVWRPPSAEDREWLTGQDLPAFGSPIAELLQQAEDRVLPYPMGNGHPRFFGWVNSPPSEAGIAVATLAARLDPSCAGGEHAGVLLERTAVRWLAELAGFPHETGAGLLTSGASMATIIAVAAARQRALGDVREEGLYGHRPLTAYVSAEGHSCIRKAVELLGLGSNYLRTVPVDADYRMDVAALRAMVAEDWDAELQPFFVAASAGTVNTGAVDPLAAIAEFGGEFGLWLHVDGAYGALAACVEPARFAGMERADSLAIDAHKWLGVPVDAGCVLFKDRTAPREAFSLVPPYLRDDGSGELGWLSEYGIEQTRPFRALRVWATIANLGREGVAELVRRTCALARWFSEVLQSSSDFELVAPVTLSIVAFRYTGAPDEDAVNEAIPGRVQRRGKAFLTGTRLGDGAALRVCILHPETDEEDLLTLLEEIRAVA